MIIVCVCMHVSVLEWEKLAPYNPTQYQTVKNKSDPDTTDQ